MSGQTYKADGRSALQIQLVTGSGVDWSTVGSGTGWVAELRPEGSPAVTNPSATFNITVSGDTMTLTLDDPSPLLRGTRSTYGWALYDGAGAPILTDMAVELHDGYTHPSGTPSPSTATPVGTYTIDLGTATGNLVVVTAWTGPQGPQGPAGPAGGGATINDAAPSSSTVYSSTKATNTFQTQAQVDARVTAVGNSVYGRRRKYDVRDYLGSDDIGAAINRAIAAAAADAYGYGKPGQVVLPPMNEAVTTQIVPMSGVDVFGSGWGKTILRPQGTVSCWYFIGSDSNRLTDLTLADFEIDGSEQTLTAGAYAVGTKGLQTQYSRRLRLEHVYIHDTAATGFSQDFMVDGYMEDCVAEGCGRLNDGTQPGGAGFGIGTGATADENAVLVGCTARGGNRYGIFFERQTTLRTYGTKLIACHSTNNQFGFGECGQQDTKYEACEAISNTKSGFAFTPGTVGNASPGRYAQLVGCTARSNSENGFLWDGTGDTAGIASVDLVGFKAIQNSKHGAEFRAGATLTVLGAEVTGGSFELNGGNGILLSGGGATWDSLAIVGARCENNGTDAAQSTRAGIQINANVSAGVIANNICRDQQATKSQQYGIGTAAGVSLSAVTISGNNLTGNAAGPVDHQGALSNGSAFRNNTGYNPRGPVAVTATASPMTYTNTGTSPGQLYIDGGTVSLITKGGVNLRTSSNASVWLEPNESVTITYSAAPNLKFDRY